MKILGDSENITVQKKFYIVFYVVISLATFTAFSLTYFCVFEPFTTKAITPIFGIIATFAQLTLFNRFVTLLWCVNVRFRKVNNHIR